MRTDRNYSALDELIAVADGALRTVFGHPAGQRPSPAHEVPGDPELTKTERSLAGQLMRVNHTGEVCAQALYQGQALTARDKNVRQAMEAASLEENDHLAWCADRLRQLDTHPSLLNPVWYAGAFTFGATFGLIGDKWSLGFLAETERQVVRHLDGHLDQLPYRDTKSRSVLTQMRDDEQKHAAAAAAAGARELPAPLRRLMGATSKIMTTTARFV